MAENLSIRREMNALVLALYNDIDFMAVGVGLIVVFMAQTLAQTYNINK